MKAMISGIGLLFAAFLFAAAQDQRDSAANQSRIIAFENAGNQAEERKDAKALDRLMDNSLLYTDYDGTLKTKADFLASAKAAGHRPEQQVTESMDAHVCGDTAVGTGVYRVKRGGPGQAIPAPGPLHGYVDSSERDMGVRSQSYRRMSH